MCMLALGKIKAFRADENDNDDDRQTHGLLYPLCMRGVGGGRNHRTLQ